MHSYITLGLLLILAVWLAFSVYDRFVIEREMLERRNDKQAELDRLQNRKAELEAEVEYLGQESGVEAEIRKHFDVAKEGEQVVVLIDKTKDDQKSTSSSKVAPEKKSFWSKLIPW